MNRIKWGSLLRYHSLFYVGCVKVRSNLINITKALKSTPGARENLILHYIQHKWLAITEKPEEGELVRLALVRIKQNPSQFDIFIAMLRDIEGMDLIVTALSGGEWKYSYCSRISFHAYCFKVCWAKTCRNFRSASM